jgi:predicted ATPase
MCPKQLSVLVGANAAGKTNLADAVDFISETYRHGLEVAVARKGGYENIAFRKMRRSKGSIRISLSVELSVNEIPGYYVSGRKNLRLFQIHHAFEFVARGYSIRAEFSLINEELIINNLEDGEWIRKLRINRTKKELEFEASKDLKYKRPTGDRALLSRALQMPFLEEYANRIWPLNSADLFTFSLGRLAPLIRGFANAMQSVRVFQISPTKTREFGVPTPRPELDRYGGNLPAVIDLMRKKNPAEWGRVVQTMRGIMPNLKSIEVDYTSSRTLGLFFREKGVGKAWGIAEVSDGTVQTLALLTAISDPSIRALVLEEPENSVHPWIIRQVLKTCWEASSKKQIIITTHSPIVINSVPPEQVWVIWRARNESHLGKLTSLDPEFYALWQRGEIPTFDYLDSGVVPAAIPPDEFDNDSDV